MLVVDAAQGIEAQTLANCYLALEHDLEIVAALNKIDLPAADPDRYAMEIENVLGIPAEDILRISAKTGEGVPELLDAVIARIPPPQGDPDAPLQALIFDSQFDQYRGVVSSVRVMNGRMAASSKLRFMQAGALHEAIEIGVRRPVADPGRRARPGRGRLPDRRHQGRRRGPLRRDGHDRQPRLDRGAARATSDPKPMVFSGLFPIDGDDFEDLRDSLEKLKLNDASITYTPEIVRRARASGSAAASSGCCTWRSSRSASSASSASPSSPPRRASSTGSTAPTARSRSSTTRPTCPTRRRIDYIEEPYFKVGIITPTTFTGTLMELCQQRRGELDKIEYLSPERVELHYVIPLAEVVVDFFDQLKSRSQGYASLDYEPAGYRRSNLVKVDLLLNGVPADAFSTIVHRDRAYDYGKQMTEKLQKLIPRQMFDVPIQAAIGGKVIARETVKARRKDVLAKCYGGDITRKRKLLEKQKEGKKKMKSIGRVEVPGDVFISALKLDD